MNQKMGLAIALALCLGVVSMQADAAQGAAPAAASGEAQPKKRRLATAKKAATDSKDSKATKATKAKDAQTGAAKAPGKKRKLASVSDNKADQAQAPAAAAAAPADKSKGKKRKLATAKTAKASKDAPAAPSPAAAASKDGKPAAPTAASAAAAPERKATAPARPAQAVPTKAVAKEDVEKPAKASAAVRPAQKAKGAATPEAGKALAAKPAAGQQDKGAVDATAQEGTSARPWAEGVSQENQQKALKAFREGNALLKDAVFAQAAVKYREALTSWDHPAIHYNLVLALLNLDRPTEVLEHLNKAMVYGPDPLDPEKYEQAKQYKTLTERQLARLVVRCELEGAVVSMDGQELFVAPGQYEGFVRPGPHSIVAKKEGYMNSEVSPSLVPGVLSEFDMILLSAADATEYRRLWPNWRPWTVFGLGVAVAAVGAGLHLKGRADVSDFDKAVNDAFLGGKEEVEAVELTYELESKRSNGLRNQKIAMALYGVGGAAVVTGAVLLYFNRLRPYTPETSTQVNPDAPSDKATKAAPEISLMPMLSPHANGMMATVRF